MQPRKENHGFLLLHALHALHALAILPFASSLTTPLDGNRYLWFPQPGRSNVLEDGLPIGNGRLAASVYGSIKEVLGINENSIWSGPCQDRIATDDPQAARQVARDMLLAGNISEGREYAMAYMIPSNNSPRSHSYFGNIEIDFGHEKEGVGDYVRWLDTKQGVTGVSYTYGGVNYT